MISKTKIIAIQPLGDIRHDLLKAVAETIETVYHLRADIFSRAPLPDEAYDPHRGQHNCYPILRFLNRLKVEQAVKIIGVTEVDLFIPILTYVFGEAQMGGDATVISTSRLLQGADKEPLPMRRVIERTTKIAVHELAHTFRLAHCKEGGCIMGTFPAPANIDEKPMGFCRYCLVFLRDEYEKLGLGWVEDMGQEKTKTP